MTTTTVRTAHDRIARLTPVRSATLRGDYLAVCSPGSDAPAFLAVEHQDRRATYRRTGARNLPGYAPRYYVTYQGMLLAWVTLDGKTHYAEKLDARDILGRRDNDHVRAAFRTAWRHQDRIRNTWPERFVMDSQGDPVL